MPCEGGEEEGEDVPGQLGRGGGAHVRLGDLHLAFQDREEGELHGHVDQGGDDGEEEETEVLTTQKEHILRPKNEFCLWVLGGFTKTFHPENFALSWAPCHIAHRKQTCLMCQLKLLKKWNL